MRFCPLAGLVIPLAAWSQALPRPGRYVETPPPGTRLWVGRTVVLRDDQTFTYAQWSDDLASSQYGSGTYRVAGGQLRLLFAAPGPEVSRARMQPLPARPDSLRLTFLVEAADTTRGIEAVAFATVTAYGASGQELATKLADAAGRVTLRFTYAQPPQLLRVAFLGMQTWQHPAPAASTAYRVRLAPYRGKPYPAGTVKVLQVQQFNGQVALRIEGGPYPLLLRPDR